MACVGKGSQAAYSCCFKCEQSRLRARSQCTVHWTPSSNQHVLLWRMSIKCCSGRLLTSASPEKRSFRLAEMLRSELDANAANACLATWRSSHRWGHRFSALHAGLRLRPYRRCSEVKQGTGQ